MAAQTSSTRVDFQQISKIRWYRQLAERGRRHLRAVQQQGPVAREHIDAQIQQNGEGNQRLRDGRQPRKRKHLAQLLRRTHALDIGNQRLPGEDQAALRHDCCPEPAPT